MTPLKKRDDLKVKGPLAHLQKSFFFLVDESFSSHSKSNNNLFCKNSDTKNTVEVHSSRPVRVGKYLTGGQDQTLTHLYEQWQQVSY